MRPSDIETVSTFISDEIETRDLYFSRDYIRFVRILAEPYRLQSSSVPVASVGAAVLPQSDETGGKSEHS